MKLRDWQKIVYSWGLEFWLPLPLIGLIFWLGTGWTTAIVLGESPQIEQLFVQKQSLPEVEVSLKVQLIAIEAKIYADRSYTKVDIDVNSPNLKELEYEFPVTEISEVEAEISQALNLSTSQLRTRVRYQIND